VRVDAVEARRHKGLRPGHYVTLAVADAGVGMDAVTQARVFDPFFTTKPIGHGTGLGLATVYGIVKQCGGYTAVASAPGAGTTFTVYLSRHARTDERPEAPRLAAPAGTTTVPGPRGAETMSVAGGTETVLVVEDERAVRNSIRRILVRHGYTVLEARHGVDALRLLDAPRPVDLVLTDLVMPEMGGRELIAELRTRRPGLPILALSGYDERAALRGEALPAGVRFLEKPFTVDGLLHSVRAVLDAGGAASSGTTAGFAPTLPAP
jgi:two-component system cell cycle sensor histidine kinase/response regulator CckA